MLYRILMRLATVLVVIPLIGWRLSVPRVLRPSICTQTFTG